MIVCEICGGRLIKSGDVFVCSDCGLAYSIEDVKKMSGVSSPAPAAVSPELPATDSPSSPKDGKQQELIDFLSAMFDAVFGSECCDEEIAVLTESRDQYPLTHLYKELPFADPEPELDDSIAKRAQDALSKVEKNREGFLEFGLRTVLELGPIHALKYKKIRRQRLDELAGEIETRTQELEEARQKQSEESLRYVQEVAAYKQREAAHKEAEEQRRMLIEAENKAVLKAYDASIAEVRKKKETFLAYAESINSGKTLYEGYLNSAAIMQLKEYLMMGVCSELEGPHGAYAFYLNELHANRICGSVEELRTAMTKGFCAILANMQSMQKELKRLNDQTAMLRSDLGRGISELSESFRGFEERVGSGIDTMTETLQETIDENCGAIRSIVQKSAYNQHLEMERERLHDYACGHECYPGPVD